MSLVEETGEQYTSCPVSYPPSRSSGSSSACIARRRLRRHSAGQSVYRGRWYCVGRGRLPARWKSALMPVPSSSPSSGEHDLDRELQRQKMASRRFKRGRKISGPHPHYWLLAAAHRPFTRLPCARKARHASLHIASFAAFLASQSSPFPSTPGPRSSPTERRAPNPGLYIGLQSIPSPHSTATGIQYR